MNSNEKLKLLPINKFSGMVKLPGSKSISNRILLLSMLAKGTTTIENILNSEDVTHMLNALRKLKIKFNEIPKQNKLTINGCNGEIPTSYIKLFLGNDNELSLRFS